MVRKRFPAQGLGGFCHRCPGTQCCHEPLRDFDVRGAVGGGLGHGKAAPGVVGPQWPDDFMEKSWFQLDDFGVPSMLGSHIAVMRIPTLGWITMKEIPCLDPRRIEKWERERERKITKLKFLAECTEHLSCWNQASWHPGVLNCKR